MRTRNKIMTVAVTGLCTAGLVLPATPASAKGGDEVRRTGNCTGVSDWKLKAKARDGGIEVEFEVDSNRVGQRWTFKMKHNGSVFASGARTTQAPSGSWSVERRVSNLAGVDSFVGIAERANGEKCRGTLSF